MSAKLLSLNLLDNRYPSLHGLRTFAIATVVQFHVTSLLGLKGIALEPGLVETSLSIFFGMDLFFVLSGFLIGSILLHDKRQPAAIGRFYLRRIFRTFPSYYLVLTTLALVQPLTPAQHANLPYEYFYLTNTRSLLPQDLVMLWGWSLSLEEQFYLTVPFLFLLLDRLKPKLGLALLVVFWLGALVVRIAIWQRHTWTDNNLRQAIYFQTYTRYDTLVAGVFLAIVHKRYGDAITRWLTPSFHRAIVAMVALLCLWFLIEPTLFGPSTLQAMHVLAWGTITSLMYIALVLLLLHGPQGAISRFLSAPIFRTLATLGYGVYLVHLPMCTLLGFPFARALFTRSWPTAVVWPATCVLVLCISFMIAYVLHLCVEKPSLWVRDKLAR